MRILLLNSVRRWGGGLTSAFVLARGLSRQHDVTVACNAMSPLRERLDDTDIAVAPLRIGPDFDPLAAAALIRAVRRARADVILLDRRKDVKLYRLARLFGLRVPAVHRNGSPSSLRDAWSYRAVWSVLAGMIVNSQAMRRELIASIPWIAGIPMDVIYNGVDVDRFRPPDDRRAARAAFGIPADAFVIAFAGVLQSRKRIDLLIRAVAAMPTGTNARLLLIGDGPERAALEALASRLAVTATFAGRRDDVATCLGAADIAAHLSSGEGFANSVLECLACGLPVVATDEHSHPEQIDDGVTGTLVPADVDTVAAALTRLACDPAARAAMGHAAREITVQRFTIPRMVDEYANVLARVARARP